MDRLSVDVRAELRGLGIRAHAHRHTPHAQAPACTFAHARACACSKRGSHCRWQEASHCCWQEASDASQRRTPTSCDAGFSQPLSHRSPSAPRSSAGQHSVGQPQRPTTSSSNGFGFGPWQTPSRNPGLIMTTAATGWRVAAMRSSTVDSTRFRPFVAPIIWC